MPNVKGDFMSELVKPTSMSSFAVDRLKRGDLPSLIDVDNRLEELIKEHLDMKPQSLLVAKRWIQATFFYDCFDAFPILFITGVSGGGKSRLLHVLAHSAYHGILQLDPTASTVFRQKEVDKSTLCLDECELLRSRESRQDVMLILNGSYTKGAIVPRTEEIGNKRVPVGYRIYGPLVITAINPLEGVLGSRAITILMLRSTADKEWKYPQKRAFDQIRDDLYILRLTHAFEAERAYLATSLDGIVKNRFVELFKPLFAITALFGKKGEWELLAEYAKEEQENYEIESGNVSEEAAILTFLKQLVTGPGWYPIAAVTNRLKSTIDINITGRKVGHILKRMDLTQRERRSTGTFFYASPEDLNKIARRLGLVETEEEVERRAIDVALRRTELLNFMKFGHSSGVGGV
jgi:hypothetical protein